MAYDPVSKTGGLTPVRVQLPPSALFMKQPSSFSWTPRAIAKNVGFSLPKITAGKKKTLPRRTRCDVEFVPGNDILSPLE